MREGETFEGAGKDVARFSAERGLAAGRSSKHSPHPSPRPAGGASEDDAVCINQEDLDERKQYVALMGKIYSQAATVLCWLGEEADDSALAFEIMQELMLSDRVALACGSDLCSWNVVSVLLSTMDYRRAFHCSPATMKVLCAISACYQGLSQHYMSSEETVATSTSQHGCTSVGSGLPCNVSTHIYSLLSLVEHGGLKACYTKTRDQLYREATKHIIDLENTLDILSSCCDPLHLREPEWATYYEQMLSSRTVLSSNYDAAVSRTGSKFNLPQKEGDMLTALLPSWIPAFHFSNKTTDRHSLGISLRSTCYYHAPGNSAPHVSFVPGREECMEAHGILVDTSQIVAVHLQRESNDLPFPREWSFWHEHLTLPSKCSDDSDRRHAFKYTVVTGPGLRRPEADL